LHSAAIELSEAHMIDALPGIIVANSHSASLRELTGRRDR
jgi:hypothetical protein